MYCFNYPGTQGFSFGTFFDSTTEKGACLCQGKSNGTPLACGSLPLPLQRHQGSHPHHHRALELLLLLLLLPPCDDM
jgi:hypothetical protein